MRSKIAVFLVVLISCSAHAVTRNCTSQERSDANTQLEEIEANEGTRMSILTEHLPFGVHRSTQSQNEQLMYQNGYMLAHDEELLTTVWVSYRLDGDDIEGAAGQDRVECFRKDPRLGNAIAARPVDYNEPTFDQGHMANDADLKDDAYSSTDGEDAKSKTTYNYTSKYGVARGLASLIEILGWSIVWVMRSNNIIRKCLNGLANITR